MFRTGPCEVKEGETYVVGIKSVFEQLNVKNDAKRKLEALNEERQRLIEAANAPLKRKPEIAADVLPAAKRVRIEPKQKAQVKKPKPSLGKKKEKAQKPKPKLKQQKMSDFFKAIWTEMLLKISLKTLVKIQNQVDFWKSFWKFLQIPPFKSPKNARRGGICSQIVG